MQALVFDVDGTLADTEATHRAAFNQAFAEEGLDWHWDEALYTRLLEVAGGQERIAHYARRHLGIEELDTALVQRLHARKTLAYEAAVGDGALTLRRGVRALIDEASRAGLPLAIATTTTPANIDALLRHTLGAAWRLRFAVLADGHSAPRKKPDPLAYQQVLDALGLPAQACLAFEDSANGLRAATAAGLPTVVTPTRYTAHHDFGSALRVLPDLAGVDIAALRQWHGEAARRPCTAPHRDRIRNPPETPCPTTTR
ncbi:protein CbbY [Pseudorhodoferax sp. Leaf267]|nr:HAD-IA family hydrolase [Pseudorhodoferax sp. Leaf267]KQP15216.1 protein CbbY [Pseudorhodoferax sp. Leaf267]